MTSISRRRCLVRLCRLRAWQPTAKPNSALGLLARRRSGRWTAAKIMRLRLSCMPRSSRPPCSQELVRADHRARQQWGPQKLAFSAALVVASALAKSERVYEKSERWRELASAWIIDVITRKRLAPVLQNPDQPAVGDGLSGHVVQAVSQAKPIERCAQSEAHRVEDQLASYTYCSRATILVELPSNRPPWVGSLMPMHSCCVRSCGVFGRG